jgi:hypothetical protein
MALYVVVRKFCVFLVIFLVFVAIRMALMGREGNMSYYFVTDNLCNDCVLMELEFSLIFCKLCQPSSI